MTGRNLFAKGKALIGIVISAIQILPPPILERLLSLFRGTKGKVGIGIRYILLKSIAKNIGDNVSIRENVVLISPASLQIGSNVSIHSNCYIDASGGITIGNDVSIATASILISETHTWENPDIPIKYNPMHPTPIIIENDVWLGCNVKVIGPTHIRDRTIIAAGAVVKGDFEGYNIVGGVPARTIKNIRQNELQKDYQEQTKSFCNFKGT